MWLDTVAALLRTRLGRPPREKEIETAPDDIANRATEEVIVTLHAQQAERLPVVSWTAKDTGDHYYLIEDQEIRETYGPTIGRVAHSHWWSVDDLPGRFSQPLGAPGWCPNSWQVNTLKTACILRVTDAAHLDERRSPGFLRVLRQPKKGRTSIGNSKSTSCSRACKPTG